MEIATTAEIENMTSVNGVKRKRGRPRKNPIKIVTRLHNQQQQRVHQQPTRPSPTKIVLAEDVALEELSNFSQNPATILLHPPSKKKKYPLVSYHGAMYSNAMEHLLQRAFDAQGNNIIYFHLTEDEHRFHAPTILESVESLSNVLRRFVCDESHLLHVPYISENKQ